MPVPSGEWPLKPIVADFECIACRGLGVVRVAVVTPRFLYLRCDHCAEVWSMPERRSLLHGRPLASAAPLKAELRRVIDHSPNARVVAPKE